MSVRLLSVRCVERGHGWSPWVVASHPCLNGDMPQSLTTNIDDAALVFEGGGMRAAHTSAVVQELIANELWFDWVGGISAGATNTINYASRDAARAATSFIDMSEDPNFGSWRTWVRGKGVFNAEYIYEHAGLPEADLRYDFATFQANPARLVLVGFDAVTGQTRWWDRSDMGTLADLMVRVRASSTMPVLMPPVTIDGEVYVDGALGPAGGIPLDAAREDGYEKFLVVLTRPRDYVKPQVKITRAMRQYFRRYPAIVDALAARASNYNATRAELLELEKAGQAMVFFPDGFTTSNGEKNIAKLARAFADGQAQVARELPAWQEWLGQPK